jgi:transketolase C-terminal domain/subunit
MSDLHLLPIPNEVKPDATRSGFGRGLVRAGEANENVVALCADLTGSIKMDGFQEAFPERFIEIGIAEQNLVTVGAGLALAGVLVAHKHTKGLIACRNTYGLRHVFAQHFPLLPRQLIQMAG